MILETVDKGGVRRGRSQQQGGEGGGEHTYRLCGFGYCLLCAVQKKSFSLPPKKMLSEVPSTANCSSVLTVILKMVLTLSLDSQWVLGKRLAVRS